jgi:hypothetical protein
VNRSSRISRLRFPLTWMLLTGLAWSVSVTVSPSGAHVRQGSSPNGRPLILHGERKTQSRLFDQANPHGGR